MAEVRGLARPGTRRRVSVKVMTWVWDQSQATGSALLVLLAIADNASDDGSNAWPSVATLCRKTRLKERAVQSCVADLQALGELQVERQAGGPADLRGDRRPNRYRVIMTRRGASDDTPHGVHEDAPGDVHGVHETTPRGAPPCAHGVHGGAPNSSLEPSLTAAAAARPVSFEFLVEQAFLLLAERRVQAKMAVGGCRNPLAYRTSTIAGLRTDLAPMVALAPRGEPWTPESLADYLEPPVAMVVQEPPADRYRPRVNCRACRGTGWVESAGGVVRCHHPPENVVDVTPPTKYDDAIATTTTLEGK